MTIPSDDYWDELGVAWRATSIGDATIAPHLKARLHLQSLLISAFVVAGAALGLIGGVVSAITIFNGWNTGTWNFVTRGVAIAAVSLMLGLAVWLLLSVRTSNNAKSLRDMFDLSIVRDEKTIAALRLGFWACAILGVFGVAGTVIRIQVRKPPAMSPILDIAILVIAALGLHFYRRHVETDLAKLRYLKRALTKDDA